MQLGDRFVRELAARFDEINQQFNLLNWIDHEIIEAGLSVESAVSDILTRSAESLHAKAASAYAVTGGAVLPFPTSTKSVELDDKLSSLVAKTSEPIIHSDEGGTFAWLILPISLTSLKSFRIVLVYEAHWYGGSRSVFHDDDAGSFAKMVADQSSILISKKVETDWHRARDDIEEAYFAGVTKNDALSVERRWFDLAQYFRKFLPNWPPLRIEPHPEVQILTYDGNKETLLLRAGTEQARPRLAKSLYIKDTVCGLLIEGEEKGKIGELLYKTGEPLYIDPTEEHGDRYKFYLLNEIPQSELVIPIRWARVGEQQKTIALVNLEHKLPKAFSETHIEILSRAVSLIAPYAAALIYEEVQQRARDIGHIYMLHGILAKMASTYRHKVGQRLTAATLSLEALEDLSTRLEGDEKKFFDRLNRSVLSFAELSRNFVSDLPNYVRFSKTPLLPLVTEAINEFDPSEMKDADDIEMILHVAPELDQNRDLQVFGSPLIREHVYNIINNSVFAVRDQLKAHEIDEGRISVSITVKKQTDQIGDQDSFPLVFVAIEDNGGGLPAEVESKYGEFGNTFGKPDGSGYGVAAAREFLLSVGGTFDWEHFHDAEGKRCLRQRLGFPFYVSEIHGPMSVRVHFLGHGGGDGGINDRAAEAARSDR